MIHLIKKKRLYRSRAAFLLCSEKLFSYNRFFASGSFFGRFGASRNFFRYNFGFNGFNNFGRLVAFAAAESEHAGYSQNKHYFFHGIKVLKGYPSVLRRMSSQKDTLLTTAKLT